MGLIIFIALVGAGILLANYVRRIQEKGMSINRDEVKGLGAAGGIIALIIIALIVIISAVVSIPVGYNMVIYNKFSKQFSAPLDSGFNIVMPVIYERISYDMRTQVYTMSGVASEGDVARADAIEVLSSDGLKMDIDITIQFRVDPDSLTQLHQQVGPDFIGKIIRPTSRESIRNEFAKHEATEAYSEKRVDIEKSLEDELREELARYFLLLEEVQIRNIQLPPTVVAAIEQKKAAQQDSERMQYILEKERQEKERVQIEAEAQAEKIRIINEQIAQSPNYLNWLAIDKLNENIELVITDGTTILDLGEMKARGGGDG